MIVAVVGGLMPSLPGALGWRAAAIGPDHLVVSEVVTGGASASDELIELHNPTAAALPLEGLELIYVTSTGGTISRRAAWPLGAPNVPPGGHVLIANEAGVYATVADAAYASGMAATGGSVAIRIQGASGAVDAVGWGTAASSWLEGTPAPAPAPGSSLERLPGGAAGSGQDTGHNDADFAERPVPEPQNLLSRPTPDPGALPSPSASVEATPPATPPLEPTPIQTVTPSGTPAATPTGTPVQTPSPALAIADARARADGTVVTIEGVALAGSSFHDGGGFVADASAGIAVLPDGGDFERGALLRLTGELDDRFSQRTLRVDAAGITVLGFATEPAPIAATTGSIGEAVEGRLVRLIGVVMGAPSELSTGLAFDLDDGSGAARVIVGATTAIATDAWTRGASVTLVGVVGQRDSTGSGVEGYRLLPRDPADVIALTPEASPTASPVPSGGGSSPSPSPSADPGGVTTIAAARAAPLNARLRVRGVVTLPSGLVDDRTAVIQDTSGAIALRLGGDAGDLALGARVEVDGTRSTLGGMETLRVTKPAQRLGSATDPAAVQLATGAADEAHEARLVTARGALVASARRSSTGTVSFEIDDGSGPLRVSVASSIGVDRTTLPAGTWVEVLGALGQDTTRARPNEGYRVWPRRASEVRIVAPATGGQMDAVDGAGGSQEGVAGGGGSAAALAAIESADLSALRVGATLVVGPWREVGIGGLLWDGSRLVAVHADSARIVARLTTDARPPLPLELGGLEIASGNGPGGAPVVRLSGEPADAVVIDAAPAPARGSLSGAKPAWVSLIGRLGGQADRPALDVGATAVRLHDRCGSGTDDIAPLMGRQVVVTGVALAAPARVVVPCGGVRPAPAVSMSAVESDGPRRPDVVGPPALASTVVAGDPRRVPVAGLLMASAAALGAATWLRRRRPVAPPETEAEPDEPTAARLTLIRVPNEHGS